MAPLGEEKKQLILTAVSELALRRLGADRAAVVQRFLARLYDHVAAADLDGRSADELYAAAWSLWQFAQQRAPAKAKLRAVNPRVAAEGWASRRTIVEIVNDDMPFLVDSVAMALAAEGAAVHLIIHPVLRISRDAAGQ